MHSRLSFMFTSQRLLTGVLVSLASSVAATPLLAQAASATSYTIGANAGIAIPVSDLGNITSSGYTVAATLGMHQPLSPVAFRVEGSFSELPWQDNVAQGAKRQIYGFALDGVFNVGTPTTNGGLYLIGGLGYYGWRDSNLQTFFGDNSSTSTTWNLGLNAGLGYYVPLSGFTVYFEGRYQNIFSSTNQVMFPITVGVAF